MRISLARLPGEQCYRHN